MFCSKCGKEIADESIVCNYCGEVLGQATTGVVTKQTGMYSKEDFLSISEDYAKEKKETERKYKNKITKCCVTMGVCGALFTILLMVMFPLLDALGVLLTVLLLFGSLGGMIGAAIMWQININKRKAELEDLADTHYRKYVNKYNSN